MMADDGRDAGCMEEPPKCLAGMFELHHYSELQSHWRQCLEYPWRMSIRIDAGKGRQYEWYEMLTTRPSAVDINHWAYMVWHRMKDKPGVREYIETLELALADSARLRGYFSQLAKDGAERFVADLEKAIAASATSEGDILPMAYDSVNYKAFCPQCGGFLSGWQSKSGSCTYETIEVWQVRDMMAMCGACGATVTATVDAEVEHVVKRCDVRLMVQGQGSSAPRPEPAVSASEMMYERIKRDKSRQERLDAIVANLGSGMTIAEVVATRKRDAEARLMVRRDDGSGQAGPDLDASERKSFNDLVCVLGCGSEIAQAAAAHKIDSKMWDAERWPPCLR